MDSNPLNGKTIATDPRLTAQRSPVETVVALIDQSRLRRECLKLAMAQHNARWRVVDMASAQEVLRLAEAGQHFDLVLIGADRLWGEDHAPDRMDVVAAMLPYAERHLTAGGRLHHISRHMLGLFHGLPGAKAWRQTLSIEASRPNAGTEVLEQALDKVRAAFGAAQAA